MAATLDKNDGGPAFPFNYTERDGSQWVNDGMTLRDYFAAKAMQGESANNKIIGSPQERAQAAYEIADAMLAERAK